MDFSWTTIIIIILLIIIVYFVWTMFSSSSSTTVSSGSLDASKSTPMTVTASNSFTISTWVYINSWDSSSTPKTIVSTPKGSNSPFILTLGNTDNGLYVNIGDQTIPLKGVTSTILVPLQTWASIIVTVNSGNSLDIYINGKLVQTTALDNVALPMIYAGYSKTDRNIRATEVLKQVGLDDRMDHQPNQLSGGQRQRVAVARALVNKPSIILADEPTGNLDSKTSEEIMKLFGDILAAGNTVILVTHEEEIAKYAHRIIRLRDGMIESDNLNEGHL